MIARCVVLVCFVLAGRALAAQPPAAPAQPAPDVAPPAAAAPASTLGRLFHTPEQRAALDEARRRPPPAATAAAPARAAPKQLPPPPEYVRLDGVVRRSDGTTSIWLNNKLVEGGRSSEGLEVSGARRAPGNVTVRIPQAGRSVELRVGQQLEVTSGKIQEGYHLPPAPGAETGPSAPRAAQEPSDTAPRPAARRSAKERELLKELLREIEPPAAERSEPQPGAKG